MGHNYDLEACTSAGRATGRGGVVLGDGIVSFAVIYSRYGQNMRKRPMQNLQRKMNIKTLVQQKLTLLTLHTLFLNLTEP
jgi:hypothetical protein